MSVQPLRGRRILVVDDEYLLAMDLDRDLTAAGAVVVGPASSVEWAEALLLSEPEIDAVVLDVGLEAGTAFPLADVLLARQIPFVFVTGFSRSFTEARYPQAPCCTKPLDFPTLERALAAAL